MGGRGKGGRIERGGGKKIEEENHQYFIILTVTM